MATNSYPVQLSVDYPDRELNRLTSAFRIFTAIRSSSCSRRSQGATAAHWNNGQHD